jgi:hypothetical protein
MRAGAGAAVRTAARGDFPARPRTREAARRTSPAVIRSAAATRRPATTTHPGQRRTLASSSRPNAPPARPPRLRHAGSCLIPWADLRRRVFLIEVLARVSTPPRVKRLLELRWRSAPQRLERAAIVAPVDPFERRKLDAFEAVPKARAADHLRPEQADHELGHGVVVNAPCRADQALDVERARRRRSTRRDAAPCLRSGRLDVDEEPCDLPRRPASSKPHRY